MGHTWAAEQLREFLEQIDALTTLQIFHEAQYFDEEGAQIRDNIVERWGESHQVIDHLISLDPIMRELMEAARPGLGEYLEAPSDGWSHEDSDYWSKIVRPNVLRAIGIHELGAEARRRMRPDSPDLVADQFHPWVWEAAAPLWFAGSRQEAVHAAARSVNARLQQKLSRYDLADAKLCREAFSLNAPAPDQPRLRFLATTTPRRGEAARTAASRSVLAASRASGTRPRTKTASSSPSKSPWSSSAPSACWHGGSTSARSRPHSLTFGIRSVP